MYDTYEIKTGETLGLIADKFKTDELTLRDINNLGYGSVLRAGMELVVPKEAQGYFEYYTIKNGDNLYQIAKKYNINPKLMSHINGIELEDYIYPGQVLLIPKSGFSYYITEEGDTLDTAASTFNISKDKLLKDNNTVYLLADQLLINKK